jgi:hypothetical protein
MRLTELQTTCEAVERPDVNMSNTKALALSLGAHVFVPTSYHP